MGDTASFLFILAGRQCCDGFVLMTQSSLLYLCKFSVITTFQVLLMSCSLSDLISNRSIRFPCPLLAFFFFNLYSSIEGISWYFRPTSEFT